MGKISKSVVQACSVLSLVLSAVGANADPGNEYCVTPPFVSGNISPNLLLMIDNSASMYDLAYVDEGKKHCTGTSNSCTTNAQCSSGQTCDWDRRPFYCFDETFDSRRQYYGYFDKDKFYYYRKANDDFAPASGTDFNTIIATAPSVCGPGNVTKKFPGNMCLEYTAAKTLVSFVAKGNYLNWLTASKFDTEKQILTGGKFDGSALIPESRGCVGQGFVKDAMSADFVNFSSAETDPNDNLQVTFTISGPSNPYNQTSPSNGGQTYINLYGGADYSYGACQQAVTSIQTSNNPADIKQDVGACLQSSGTATGTCTHMPVAPVGKTQLAPLTCGTNSDCYLSTANSASTYVCEYSTGRTCTGPGDTTSCAIAARNSCSLDTSRVCTTNTDCQVPVAAVSGVCTTNKSFYTPNPGRNDNPPLNKACTSDAACNWAHGNTTFTAKAGACVGFVPASTINKGSCVLSAAADYGPCTNNYVGDCALSAQAAAVKTKVNFSQVMQECWTIRGQIHTAADRWGFPNVNTIKNSCPDIFASYKTCRDNHLVQCSSDNDCTGFGTAACDAGPGAIAAGSPALVCGTNYAGQYFQLDARGNWVVKATATDLDIAKAEYDFCQLMNGPNVTDPSDSPSDTSTTENLPAILSGIGVEAQLGSPIIRMRAKVAVTTPACTKDSDCGAGKSCSGAVCKPSGLIQEFGSQMRIGAMSFNKYGVGNATESALSGVKLTRTCSNHPEQVCTQAIDCGPGPLNTTPTCDPTTVGTSNLDGGSVIYPVGKGTCGTQSTTACKTDAQCSSGNRCYNNLCTSTGGSVCTAAQNCSSGSVCVPDLPGDHGTSQTLVNTIDTLVANAWTPFGETFYNALGYFAPMVQNDGTIQGRIGLRLNNNDFVATQHPSEYRCQQNYVLLVTDGSSTADRNSAMTGLGGLYTTQAGMTSTADQINTAGICPPPDPDHPVDYGGTSYLPVLSWIGRHHNLATFSTDPGAAATVLHCAISGAVCSASTPCPAGDSCTNAVNPRDYVTTYVVFNGADTGSTSACNATTLLDKTATNGGTKLEKASDPETLKTALTGIFQNIAAKASSGTAASILSNSEGSGANILQAVFYPKKIFGSNTSVNWIGEMQNLWYFVDPKINHSTIRDDFGYSTGSDTHTLNLARNKVVSLRFDPTDNTTYGFIADDANGDGIAEPPETKINADDVKSIWRAGKKLWARDLASDPRSIKTTLNGTSLLNFTPPAADAAADKANWARYLNVAADKTPNLMKYVHGSLSEADRVASGYRDRAVVITGENDDQPRPWLLGDIISSTPRIQSNVRLNSYGQAPPGGYSDASYNSFTASEEYKSRGMVYVGANDGMLHAFRLGDLDVTATDTVKAKLKGDVAGDRLGREKWAFIPRQVLPYLQYHADPLYSHLYYVDGSTVVTDASIGNTTGDAACTGSYDTCPKPKSNFKVVDGANFLDPTVNTWRTVLIGGMGIGGATAKTCTTDNCVQTPLADPDDNTNTKGLGYSAYFALDITDPNNPSLLWEFSHPQLGYATSGPAIVRVGDANKNGKWFAVFGSGPTGPINTTAHQFLANSDQKLRFFVVDLRTGHLDRIIETDIENAFAGSMVGGAIDADRWNPSANGNYQDDAIYVGYTKKSDTTWTDGGVLRIVTNESTDPDSALASKRWTYSKVLDGVGPVTTAISRLQDRKNKRMWLYFGTGRYFSRVGENIDDKTTRRAIYGIKDPCYNTANKPGNLLDNTCSATITSGSITNQTSSIAAAGDIGAGGWKIDLDNATGNFGAERVVTDAVALTNGTIFLTSFMPTADPCGFGGNSFLWALDYQSGGRPSDAALGGKALIQLSTGEFKEVDLGQVFGAAASKLMRRASVNMTGKPPADAFPVISKSANKPVKRIMHIQER